MIKRYPFQATGKRHHHRRKGPIPIHNRHHDRSLRHHGHHNNHKNHHHTHKHHIKDSYRHKRQWGQDRQFNEIESGPWFPWDPPSVCSRTCGGGVAVQTRHCNSHR